MSNRFNKGIDNLKQEDNVSKIYTHTIDQQEKHTASMLVVDENQADINIKDNIISNTHKNILDNTILNISSNVKVNTLTNILDNILVNSPTGSNFTFYLSDDVSKAIAKFAKEKNISKSKLVDTLLKQVLLNK